MKKIITGAFVLFMFCMAAAFAQKTVKGDDILGKWKMEGNASIIGIYKKDSIYYAKIEEIKGNNNTSAKTGTYVLKNFRFDDKGQQWKNGQVFAPRRNKYFDAIIKMKDKNTIIVTAYVSFYSKSVTWTRIEK